MAPKRTAKVVRTTKKVIEETVEVLTVPDGGDSRNAVDVSPAGGSRVVEVDVRTEDAEIPIGEKPTREGGEPAAGERDKEDVPRTPKTVEKPPQREHAPAVEEGGEKETEAVTPEKVEQPAERDAAEKERDKATTMARGRRRRTRMKRYSGPGGGVGEMDGVGRGYKRYVFQVLKQVHPELGISSRAMAVVDGMLGDMFERLADEAGRLSAYVGKTTLSSREIQSAVQLVLPGDLGKHAITEGTRAVTNYMAAGNTK